MNISLFNMYFVIVMYAKHCASGNHGKENYDEKIVDSNVRLLYFSLELLIYDLLCDVDTYTTFKYKLTLFKSA